MEKTIICIGGGELRTKRNVKSIDSYIAQKAFLLAGVPAAIRFVCTHGEPRQYAL